MLDARTVTLTDDQVRARLAAIPNPPAPSPAPSPDGGGRPSSYNDEIAMRICHRVARGETVKKICEDAGYPARSVVYDWLCQNEAFARRYAIARYCLFEDVADEVLGIVDGAFNDVITVTSADGVKAETISPNPIAHAKLRCDQRWIWLAKMFPRRYGDPTVQALHPGDNAREINPSAPVIIENDPIFHSIKAWDRVADRTSSNVTHGQATTGDTLSNR